MTAVPHEEWAGERFHIPPQRQEDLTTVTDAGAPVASRDIPRPLASIPPIQAARTELMTTTPSLIADVGPLPGVMSSPSRSQWWSRGLRSYAFDVYMRSANLLLSAPGHALRNLLLKRMLRFEMGVDVAVERGLRVEGRGGVTIGDRCNINRDVTLDGRGGLTIGSDVNISPEVMVLTGDHDPNSPDFESRARPVVISDRAWIATRAVVLGGSSIGEGAVVAGGAVVHGEVAPWTIVGGNPAKVIGHRSREAQTTMGPPYRRFFH